MHECIKIFYLIKYVKTKYLTFHLSILSLVLAYSSLYLWTCLITNNKVWFNIGANLISIFLPDSLKTMSINDLSRTCLLDKIKS